MVSLQDSNKKISAIILAGGQGRRMGYQDKGLIQWHGKSLITHVIERIKQQVDEIVINCNQNQEQYQQFGYPIITDRLNDFQGPLAGIEAGLEVINHEYCLICPCDTPFLPATLVKELYSALQTNKSDAAYPVCGQQRHYIPVLLHKKHLPSLQQYLATGQRSIHGWYQSINTTQVGYTDQQAFANFNQPSSLTMNDI
jgi:molybdenum cofactor guanylyltransferase